MADWVIEFYRGKVDIRRDRRAFRYDLDDLDEALTAIKRSRKFTKGDSVVVIEDDGARRKLKI